MFQAVVEESQVRGEAFERSSLNEPSCFFCPLYHGFGLELEPFLVICAKTRSCVSFRESMELCERSIRSSSVVKTLILIGLRGFLAELIMGFLQSIRTLGALPCVSQVSTIRRSVASREIYFNA